MIAPVCLNPTPLLITEGNVDNPTSTVFPVTPMDIGELPLVIFSSLPQENLQKYPLVVAIPTVFVPESTTQVITLYQKY